MTFKPPQNLWSYFLKRRGFCYHCLGDAVYRCRARGYRAPGIHKGFKGRYLFSPTGVDDGDFTHSVTERWREPCGFDVNNGEIDRIQETPLPHTPYQPSNSLDGSIAMTATLSTFALESRRYESV
jgi:hypothetical protein